MRSTAREGAAVEPLEVMHGGKTAENGMMKRILASRTVVAIWLALGCYSLLSMTMGPGGLFAWQSMGESVVAMQGNIEALKNRNRELSSDFASLRSDPDRARREARALGYLPEGEYEVVLTGAGRPSLQDEGPGTALSFDRPETVSDALIKAIAAGLGLLWLALGEWAPQPSALISGKGRKASPKARRAKAGTGNGQAASEAPEFHGTAST